MLDPEYFIAVIPPKKVQEGYAELREYLKDSLEVLGWVLDRDKFLEPYSDFQAHITLRFIGKLPHSQIEKLIPELGKIIHPKFHTQTNEIAYFPITDKQLDEQANVIFWALLDKDEQWQELFKEVNDVIAQTIGIEYDYPKFIPHITLAKAPKGQVLEKPLKEEVWVPEPIKFPVDSFVLVESFKPEGQEGISQYKVLKEFQLY